MKSKNESSYEESFFLFILCRFFGLWLFCALTFFACVHSDHISRVVADLEPLLAAELEKMEQIESEAGGLPVPCFIEVTRNLSRLK